MLLDFLCELYYDARIHEHQGPLNVAAATGHTRRCGDPESESRPSDRLF